MRPQQDTEPDQPAETPEPAGKPYPAAKDRRTRRHGPFGTGTRNLGRGRRRRAEPMPVHPALRPLPGAHP